VQVAPEDGKAEPAQQEWVVVASFENRHSAERMLLSLGHRARKKARKAGVSAFVVSGKNNASLKLTESRVLEANRLTALLLHISLSWTVGFLGVLSMFKGAKGGVHAAKKRGSSAGSNEGRANKVIAEVGPNAAIMLVPYKNADVGEAVAAGAAERGRHSWHGPLAQFLAGLEPGTTDDLIRSALDEPSGGPR
jgi:hypothetical protein